MNSDHKGSETLRHSSGVSFQLNAGPETTIGRSEKTTGISPDIDLTEVDSQRSVSRRHARIYRRGFKFFVGEEIGTMNATYVNGTRLETGVPVEIHAGDKLRFSVVELEFQP